MSYSGLTAIVDVSTLGILDHRARTYLLGDAWAGIVRHSDHRALPVQRGGAARPIQAVPARLANLSHVAMAQRSGQQN